MYEVNNNVAKINGVSGKYSDKTVTNPSEKYGRNAVDNYYAYLEKPIVEDSMNPASILDFGLSPDAPEKNAEALDKFVNENDNYLKALPPLEFEYRYMPKVEKGQIDKAALLGAAYEEMGKRDSISVKEMDDNYAPSKDFSFESLDINKDKNIDKSEYAASILAADMLSKPEPEPKNVDGTINNKGMNALMEYTKKSNAQAAAKLYSSLYSTYKLGE